MVKFYVNRIKNGGMTIDEVPSLWKKKVEAELAKENNSIMYLTPAV